jgi:hypothetical protein
MPSRRAGSRAGPVERGRVLATRLSGNVARKETDQPATDQPATDQPTTVGDGPGPATTADDRRRRPHARRPTAYRAAGVRSSMPHGEP